MSQLPPQLPPTARRPAATHTLPEHWLAALAIAHRVVRTLVSHHDPAVRQAAQTLATAFATDQHLPCDEQTRWQRLSTTDTPGTHR
ncbi:MAG: hypothetical protein AB4911_16345 [Oscillochloridaceae bacterium umkhey_bin13]